MLLMGENQISATRREQPNQRIWQLIGMTTCKRNIWSSGNSNSITISSSISISSTGRDICRMGRASGKWGDLDIGYTVASLSSPGITPVFKNGLILAGRMANRVRSFTCSEKTCFATVRRCTNALTSWVIVALKANQSI